MVVTMTIFNNGYKNYNLSEHIGQIVSVNCDNKFSNENLKKKYTYTQ